MTQTPVRRSRRLRHLVLVSGLLVALGAPLEGIVRRAGQVQAPAESQAQTPTTSAVLIGQVVDASTGNPVPEAIVTLIGRPAPGRGRRAGGARGANLADLMAAARGGGRGSADRIAADADGRFVFRDLPAARYTIRAEAAGYLPGGRGPLGRGGAPATITVAAGDTSARVTVPMRREAVVTGVVVDEASEPVIRARVTAYRLDVTRFGAVSYNDASTVLTDDRGAYRMYGLMPGTYLVGVPQQHATTAAAGADAMLQSLLTGQVPEGGVAGLGAGATMDPDAVRVGEWRLSSTNVNAPPLAGDGQIRAYRSMYYPAALVPGGADPVVLLSGEERAGVDFALTPVLTGRITGVVSAPSGPVANVPVRVVPADDALPGMAALSQVASGVTSADGRFTLLAVPPGQYRVVAEREAADFGALPDELMDNPMMKLALQMRGNPTPLYGETTASLGDGATVDVVINGSEGVTVTGQVAFEGTAPEPDDIAQMRVTLRALDDSATGARLVRLDGEGRFVLEGVLPGRYAVAVAQGGGNPGGPGGPTGQRLVSEVIADGRNLDRSPVIIADDDVTVAVTLTDRLGTLRGTVRPSSSAQRPESARSLTALVVPAGYIAWTDIELAAMHVRVVPVADAGTFSVSPLLAGEYLVAVVDESGVDLSGGLPALRALAGQATRVDVPAGGDATVMVDVVGGRE